MQFSLLVFLVANEGESLSPLGGQGTKIHFDQRIGIKSKRCQKEAKLELTVVSHGSHRVQGQCPVVAVMTYGAKQCLTAVGATCVVCVRHWWYVVLVRLLLLPGFQTLFKSCSFAKSTSLNFHELQKFSLILQELGAVACNQGVWLAHGASPCEPCLTPVTSFSVDPA